MRILGVNIPDEKKLSVALTYIYGLGRHSAEAILASTGLKETLRAKDLKPEDIAKIQSAVEAGYKVEGELRQILKQNIAHLKEVGSYRGSRHAKHLPVRGQRTRRNTRTVRGNVRRTVGSGKRKVELK